MIKLFILIKLIGLNNIVKLNTPKNISYLWNGGRFLIILIIIQIFSGVVLTFYFNNGTPFESIEYIMRNISSGFYIRWVHINGATFIFILIYMHIFRSVYYTFYYLKNAWITGVILFILLILVAFLGYVLPFGQISYWAAVVITKFAKSIPYIGLNLVTYLWRGYGVRFITLKFFYSLHYLLPFILLVVILIHTIALHLTGRSNPIFLNTKRLHIKFYPKYVIKDIINILAYFGFLIIVSHLIFFEAVNYTPADFVITPTHIKPEWYFLFAYGILRSVPNKLFGIIIIALSVVVFFKYIFYLNINLMSTFKRVNKIIFFVFILNFIVLSWVGGNPISDFFITNGTLRIFVYFMFFIF
jgi:ubiquinol-cytochrome c reductase cytochrome b subunit